ncbi:MAG: bifunctional homocysteine S-methyltransferase/methylenetetrahydrofolate reductase [Clostridiales bacterium]|nr:bifunctional homocysteine S-methyltransferase/methylenetetrahydrofolate reductase [Clostridiales bacterium]
MSLQLPLREYLKSNILVTDGAMGTLYSQYTGLNSTLSEPANIDMPELIRKIHNAYIKAGAKLIRTNTFSANTITLNLPREKVREIIRRGYDIAAESAAVNKDVYVAADIGPVPETGEGRTDITSSVYDEYKFIVDEFLDCGSDIFIFETFGSFDFLEDIAKYIKSKNESAFILTQFAINSDGYTRKGIHAATLQKEARSIRSIDAYGFNCGVGAAHIYKVIRNMDFIGDIVSVLPNSGYPELVNERNVYTSNPEYFADKMMDIRQTGARILGGCCGTTPSHIAELSDRLQISPPLPKKTLVKRRQYSFSGQAQINSFSKALSAGRFTIAVELDPPFGIDMDKLISGARELKDAGVDAITVADSPMARAGVDSIIAAAKLKREVDIETIPHICCRDRNIIALKSAMVGAYIEGIRNLLIITGDPIASQERSEIKSVFNLNSMQLLDMADTMNQEIFKDDPFYLGAALNLNVHNRETELKRMEQKINYGAKFFLTQPVYQEDAVEYLKRIKNEGKVKVLAGILPPVSYRNAVFLNNEVPGLRIPDHYIKRFSENMSREEKQETGIGIAGEIIRFVRPYVDGIYFIAPFRRTDIIVEIIKRYL